MPVIVRPMQASLTHDTDFFPIDRMDPYVYISIGGERRRTSTCMQGGRNPCWGDVMQFANPGNDMMLNVEVWDRDTFTPDDIVGQGSLNIAPFMNGMPMNQQVQLHYKGRYAGTILLSIQATGNMMGMGMGGMGMMPMGGMGMTMPMGGMGMGMGMGMPMGGMGMGGMGMGMGGMGMNTWSPNYHGF